MRSEPTQIPAEPATEPEDARARSLLMRDSDPFPDIAPALLNSADIYDYVRAAGMILPFEESRLNKLASYEASIGRRYICWTPDGRNVDRFLQNAEEFVLYPNSIGFITTEEFFRLPHYIAARFNLRITNVHRGLLVGTGPLVDPGFSGRLLIPLHNLTTNEYRFRQGEQFAWFEFTKLSINAWNPGYDDLRRKYCLKGDFVRFPDEKIEIAQDPRKYLAEAAPDGVRSSIPEAIAGSAQSAERASASAHGARTEARQASAASEAARSTLFKIGIGAGVAGVAAVAALWYDSRQLATQLSESVERLRESYAELKDETEGGRHSLAQEIEALARNTQESHSAVRAEQTSLQRQLDNLQAQLEGLENRIDGDRSQQQ